MIDIESFAWCYVCVALRFGPVFLSFPFLSGAIFSWGTRLLLGLIACCSLVPLLAAGQRVTIHGPMAQILSTLLSELLFGTMLAISMHLFLIVFRTSGHLLGSLAGVNLGSDSESEEENGPLIEKFAVWVSGIVFVLVGAHRWMLNLVLESLRDYPLGAIGNNEQMFSDIGNNWTLIPLQFGAALAIGIKLALPATFLLFVVQLAGEWVRRSLHTWDHAALGGAIPFVGLIAALMVFTSGIGLTFEQEIARWADQVQRNVVEPAAWSNRIEESTNNSSTSAALQVPNTNQDQRSRGGLSDG